MNDENIYSYTNPAYENDQRRHSYDQMNNHYNTKNLNLTTPCNGHQGSNGTTTHNGCCNGNKVRRTSIIGLPVKSEYGLKSQDSVSETPKEKGCLEVILEPMMMDNNMPSSQPTCMEKIKFAVSLPPHGRWGNLLSWVIYTVIFWGALVSITGKQALPGGNLFSLLVTIIVAQLGGMLAEKVKLPPLIGMIIVGVMLRSVPGINMIGENIDPKWSATIRKMALVVILTRAGLGLDPKALRALSLMVIRMGIVPNLMEMCVVAVVSHFLMSFPWLWSFLLGFIFSAVSPSVVVPCMLTLSERNLGVNKGMPTLVIAGLSVDNALSISGIGVMLGIIFSEGSVLWQAFKGPVEVCIGIAFGIVMGAISWTIPNRFEKGYAKFRFFFLFTVGLLSVFGSQRLNFGGAGAMGCLATSFVAGIGWRNQGWKDNDHPVKNNFNFLWSFFQPLLFSLIGSEIKISALSGATVGWGALTLLIGLIFRLIVCFAVVHRGNLNFKEKLFAAIAWIPKATIQAAFGSTAYDFARARNEDGLVETQEEIYGRQILTLAVLAIVIAAPIGAISIMATAPKLLDNGNEKEETPTQTECERVC